MNAASLAGHAIELLDNIVKTTHPADRTIADFYRTRRYIGSHDRKWITEKIYGIIRNFILLKDLEENCAPGLKALGVFLAHEIRFASMTPGEIVESYGMLLDTFRLTGNKIDIEKFTACIRTRLSILSDNPQNVFLLNSFPDFFVDLLPSSVRQDVVLLMSSLNHEAQVCLRVDTGKISREQAVASLAKEEIEASVSKFSPLGVYLPKRVNLNNLSLYKEGFVEVQEEGSQLVGLLVDPKKDETIVDACAGAGGKSLEFAALSGGLSKIFALDLEKDRLDKLKARANRSGYENITTIKVSDGDSEALARLIGEADKVVVDAPCTGSGTIRRNPDKKFRLTKMSVEKQSEYQKELLARYARLVRPEGLLFYMTCSIFEKENHSVIESFLESDQRFQLINASEMFSDSKFSDLIENNYVAIYPHRHDMDGFFAAVMKRLS